MKKFTEKLEEIKNELLSEKGSLRFLALFYRNDETGLCDLIIAGDWIEEGKTRKSIKILLQKFNDKQINYEDFVENIVAFSNNDMFLHHVASAYFKGKITETENGNTLIKLFDDFVIEAKVLHKDFQGFELKTTKMVKKREKVEAF